MIEYPKIETLFERDTQGSKKLIEGRFRNPAVEYLFGTANMEGLVGRPAVDLLDRLGRRVIVKIKVRDFQT